MPEIDGRAAQGGMLITAYIDRGTGGASWWALPFAYQAPNKTAAIVTYRYQEGSFTVAVVSPVPEMVEAIVNRIDGHMVKVVITP